MKILKLLTLILVMSLELLSSEVGIILPDGSILTVSKFIEDSRGIHFRGKDIIDEVSFGKEYTQIDVIHIPKGKYSKIILDTKDTEVCHCNKEQVTVISDTKYIEESDDENENH